MEEKSKLSNNNEEQENEAEEEEELYENSPENGVSEHRQQEDFRETNDKNFAYECEEVLPEEKSEIKEPETESDYYQMVA